MEQQWPAQGIAAEMAEDVVTEVAVTLVTAPVPGRGKIAVEMGKQAPTFRVISLLRQAHPINS